MNIGTLVVITALLLSLGVLVVQVKENQPEEGWIAWLRESFETRRDPVPSVETEEFTIANLFDESETGSGYTTLDELVRR